MVKPSSSIDASLSAQATSQRQLQAQALTQQKPPPWFEDAQATCRELVRLPAKWNSYGAMPVDSQIADAALAWLRTLAMNVPKPAIVPTGRGGIQIEWHTGGIDLEVVFPTLDKWEASFEHRVTAEERELVGTGSELDKLNPFLACLTQSA